MRQPLALTRRRRDQQPLDPEGRTEHPVWGASPRNPVQLRSALGSMLRLPGHHVPRQRSFFWADPPRPDPSVAIPVANN